MSEITGVNIAKTFLPAPIRRGLRGCLHYVQRVGRWAAILWQVRGATWQDQWYLVSSALIAPILSFERLLEWQDPILITDAQVHVRNVGCFKVRAHCDDLWHVLPWREQAIFTVFRQLLRPGDSFIDAGANIGVYSVLAARLVGPRGNILAVEMMPDTADRLELNLVLNEVSNVTVCRAALSSLTDQYVTAEVTPGKYGQASIARKSRDSSANCIEVKTTTFDELSKYIARVRLIKMDLEGAEALALGGAKVVLDKTDYLIYESCATTRTSNSPVDACLREAGFTLCRIDGNNWLASKCDHSHQNRQSAQL